MKFFILTLTGSMAFWQLFDLRDTNYPAFVVIVLIYSLYGAIWAIRDHNSRKGR